MEIQEFMSWRPGHHLILGGDFNVSLHGVRDFLHVGESIPRPRTLVDTSDSLRARALHTMVTELDLTVTNTWMNADTEQELFTRSSWTNREDSLTQMEFIMTSRKLETKHVQVLDSDWFKTDHRAVLAVLSLKSKMRHTKRNGANLRGWEPDESWHRVAAETLTLWENWNAMGPLLMETAVAHRKLETKEMSVTELELKSLLLRKKKTGRHRERTELNWLCQAIWRKRTALKQEKHLTKIKESAEIGKAPNKTQSKHFNWSSIAKHEKPRICSHKLLPRPLIDSGRGDNPIRETTLGRAVEKLENRLCRRNVGFTKETGKCLEETEKRERLTGSNHSRCFESIASRIFGKAGEVAVVDVLEHDFPGSLAVLDDGNGSETGGCNVLDQVQANRWAVCDAKRGCVWLKSLPPLKYESVQTAFVPKTHADAGLFLLLQAAELYVKKAFDHVDHRAAFKAMKLQGVMALIAAI